MWVGGWGNWSYTQTWGGWGGVHAIPPSDIRWVGVSNSAFAGGGGERWGCLGAGEMAAGDPNLVPPPGAPDLLAGSEAPERTKAPGDICDAAAPSPC